MAAITNTTLVSNFAAVGRLNLLHLCWENLYIPEQVFAEIQEGRMQGYTFYDNIEREISPFASDGSIAEMLLIRNDYFVQSWFFVWGTGVYSITKVHFR